MKGIIGNPARNEKFFDRKDILDEIYEAIEDGNNLLISAPRRVGKTSILFYLADHPTDKFYIVYTITESINDSNQFFQKLFESILDSDTLDNYGKIPGKAIDLFKEWASRIKSFSIKDGSIEFADKREGDFYKEFLTFLDKIDLNGNQIVLMIDEFPVTVENIIKEKGTEAAISFLKQNRAIRQNEKLSKKIKFIYTGSIGLYSIVRSIDSTVEINDLMEIKVKPLSLHDSKLFITKLLSEHNINISSDSLEYLIDKIEWTIPFYLQLAAREIRDIYQINPKEIDRQFINVAFNKIIENGNIYFDHYRGRLNKIFEHTELEFIKALLKKLAETISIQSNVIHDLAVKYSVENKYKLLLDALIYDGYIMNTTESDSYRFYSPILKKWWEKNV
jgi:uncharacterized protein